MCAQNVAVTKALMESDNASSTADMLDSINVLKNTTLDVVNHAIGSHIGLNNAAEHSAPQGGRN